MKQKLNLFRLIDAERADIATEAKLNTVLNIRGFSGSVCILGHGADTQEIF